MIAEEGKAGRKVGEKWSAKMVPSPAASNRILLSGVDASPSLRTLAGIKGLPARVKLAHIYGSGVLQDVTRRGSVLMLRCPGEEHRN